MPIRALFGNSSRLRYDPTSASRRSSRARTAPISVFGAKWVSISFIECTAASDLPARIDRSSSLINRPLPPTLISGRSKIRSPCVVTGLTSTAAGWSAEQTISACTIANRDARLANLIGSESKNEASSFISRHVYRPYPKMQSQKTGFSKKWLAPKRYANKAGIFIRLRIK